MTVQLGPSLEMQEVVSAALRSSAALITIFGAGQWPYQDVPAKKPLPYLTIGEGRTDPDMAECIDGSVPFLDLHIWAATFAECKTIHAAIVAALSSADLSMTQNRCLLLERTNTQFLRDNNGTTKHAITTFRATTEPLG